MIKMESLPAELISQIYVSLGKYSKNFRKVSMYIRDCYPGHKYMHKMAFSGCLKDIESMEYKTVEFSNNDIANYVGTCLFTGMRQSTNHFITFTETYSLRKLKTKITATVYRSQFSGYDINMCVFDEICVITNKQSPNFRNFNCVGIGFDRSVTEISGIDDQRFKYYRSYCGRQYLTRDGEIIVKYGL